jgi:hypothetical protein
VETSGTALKEPLCPSGAAALSALVYWAPVWRPDQKEPPLREAAALRGIQDFLAGSGCAAGADVRRLPGDLPAAAISDEQLLRLASVAAPAADRVLLVVVRELGPTLRIGIPVLVEGGTEVVLDVRVLDARSARPLADVRTQWRHGGAFVVKGVQNLDQDMSAALRTALTPAAPPR